MLALCVVVVLLAGVIAALAAGRFGGVSVGMPDPVRPGAHQPLGAGEVTRADLAAVRFDRAPRGYRMDEVDAVLDRLGEELAARDERLAELTRRLEGHDAAWPSETPATTGAPAAATPATPLTTEAATPVTTETAAPTATTTPAVTGVELPPRQAETVERPATQAMPPAAVEPTVPDTLSRPQAPREL